MNREGREVVIDTLFRAWRQSLEEILKGVPTPETNEAQDWIAAAYSHAARSRDESHAGYGSMEQQTIARLQVENEHLRRVTGIQGRTIEALQHVRRDNETMTVKLNASGRIIDNLRDEQRHYHDVYAKNQLVADENKQLQTVVTVAGEKIRELEQRLRHVIPSKDAQDAIIAGLLALAAQYPSPWAKETDIEAYMRAAFLAHHWADKASA